MKSNKQNKKILSKLLRHVHYVHWLLPWPLQCYTMLHVIHQHGLLKFLVNKFTCWADVIGKV